MAKRGKVSREFSKLPQPKTPREKWERDQKLCWAMLDELENTVTLNGQKWVLGMKKHWEQKLRDLLDNPPLNFKS